MGHQLAQLRDDDVDPLRQSHAGAARQRRRQRKSRRRSGTQLDIAHSTRKGCSTVPTLTAANAAQNAFVAAAHRSVRLRAERRRGRRRRQRRRLDVRQRRLLPGRDPVRLQLHVADVQRDAHAARRLPVVRRLGRPHAQLERLGLDLRARRARDVSDDQRHAHLLPGARSSSRRPAQCRRFTPSTARRASSSTTRSRWRNWTFNVGLLMSNDTLYGQGLREDASTLSGYHGRAGQQVQDVRHSVLEDDAAAAWRDLGLRRHEHRLRELREVQPGGQLAAARRVVGPQPRERRSTPTSTRTATCSRPTRSRRRRASSSCRT